MTELYYIKCNVCDLMYLVGIDGKDVYHNSGEQKETNHNYFAIGNDELEQSPKVKTVYPCKQCNKKCKVKKVKSRPI